MKKRYILIFVVGLIAVVVGASLYGYGRWDNSRTFVTTGNARVVVDLIDVGPINSGRITEMNVEEGEGVDIGDIIAKLDIDPEISTSEAETPADSERQDGLEKRIEVLRAPMDAVVATRQAVEGETVPADQPVVTLMDTSDIWVVADISEGDIEKVRIGQEVEVTVASSDTLLTGRVDRISRVTRATVEQRQDATSNTQRMPEVVPVRIALDGGHRLLIPGSSANVRIRVR